MIDKEPMYELPDHLKSLPQIERINDTKYKLTELSSLLEFLLKEIDQDRNPAFSLGELVIHYSHLFSAPKLVSTGIGIRNFKIHGTKTGGRIYNPDEIEAGPKHLARAVEDLLPHVSTDVAEAVRREEIDLGDVLKKVIKHIRTIESETAPEIPSLLSRNRPLTSIDKVDPERSIDGAKVVGGNRACGVGDLRYFGSSV